MLSSLTVTARIHAPELAAPGRELSDLIYKPRCELV